MPLLRYQVFLSYGIAFIATWLYCLTNKNKLSSTTTTTEGIPQLADIVITFAPIFAIIVLGIYLLSRLIFGVLAFEDCPAAAKEIDAQITEAKTEMKRRKVIE